MGRQARPQGGSLDIGQIAAEARRILASNRQSGISAWEDRSYDFVCPSQSNYPFQWFWGSAFHAIALLHIDPALAKQEVRCLLQAARADGFIPHMTLWDMRHHEAALAACNIILADPFHTATIQPPVLARVIERVYDATGDRAWLAEVLPPVVRFFAWLHDHRDPDGDGLIAIIQPDESGLDASPKYDVLTEVSNDPPERAQPRVDEAMARLFDAYAPHRATPAQLPLLDVFNWEDVMVNAIYGDGLRALARLCDAAGQPAALASELAARAARVTVALQEQCWDEQSGVFWDRYGKADHSARVLTFTCLFQLILPDLDPTIAHRLINEHLLNEREFWLPFPVPSVAANEPSFDPEWHTKTTWRGPTWVNVNWYLYWGLRARGFAAVATELARRTISMVEQGGVREFFNPYTGEGQGTIDFGWTCLVLDLIAAEGAVALSRS